MRLANQHWLFLFSWLFPRCWWLICLIICSSAFPGTEIELTGCSCLAPHFPFLQPGKVLLCREPQCPVLLLRVHGGSQPGLTLVWVLQQSHQTNAFLSLPLTTNLCQNGSLLPSSLTCASYVSFTSFSILSTTVHADLWCQPWADCMYLSFSVCFLAPCGTPENWLTQPLDLSPCSLTFNFASAWLRFGPLQFAPVDNSDIPKSLGLYFPKCLLASVLCCLKICGAQHSLSVGKCRNSDFQWNYELHPLSTGLSQTAQDFLFSVTSLSFSKSKHSEPNSDLIYTSKIWTCASKLLKLFWAYSDENESSICLINSPNPQKVNDSKRK